MYTKDDTTDSRILEIDHHFEIKNLKVKYSETERYITDIPSIAFDSPIVSVSYTFLTR